jgi:malonate-semialdehyde dehydrogenase (acetylating)/methylmalonate-semialdehyde dehydrogenase
MHDFAPHGVRQFPKLTRSFTESRHDMNQQLVRHWIGGRESGDDTRTAGVTDPATGRESARVALASDAEVDAAVAAATAAFQQWKRTSLAKRTSVLFAFRELLNQRKPELAELITAEHGKVFSDALAEVSRGQEVVEFACGIAHVLKGEFTANASTAVDVHSVRAPLGPVAIITPFNFPAMVPMWFFPIAIAAGNTVVLKPSEKVPSAALWIAKLWKEAGLPDGVFNVVNGDRESVDALLVHPGIKSVSFVGSTPVARHIYSTASAAGKRVQALGGAKNHMVVMPDADLDLAAEQVVNGGFGSAGERCMAVSAVLAAEEIADDLVSRIIERADGIRVGDGRRSCDMGPLVSRASQERVIGLIADGVKQGASLALDGRIAAPDADGDGFFVGPTVFDRVTTDMSIYTEEIFGPVVSVVRFGTLADALGIINANPYGNGTAIFTNDGAAARTFEEEVEVGMVGINVPVPVPVAYFSFGGWKNSLFGDSHAHGTEGVKFFTRGKVVTSRWPIGAQGSLELGFPTN